VDIWKSVTCVYASRKYRPTASATFTLDYNVDKRWHRRKTEYLIQVHMSGFLKVGILEDICPRHPIVIMTFSSQFHTPQKMNSFQMKTTSSCCPQSQIQASVHSYCQTKGMYAFERKQKGPKSFNFIFEWIVASSKLSRYLNNRLYLNGCWIVLPLWKQRRRQRQQPPPSPWF
jgi:hypothetical protein